MCQRSEAPPRSLKPLHRDELTALALRRDATPLSQLVRVALDISTMWRDDDEPGVHAVIVQPLDKFAVGLGLGVVEYGMWHL